MLFDGPRLSGVLDYDRVVYDLTALDFAYSLKAFGRDLSGGDARRVGFDPERCREFLHAYGQIRPVPEADLAALPLIFRAQRLIKVVKKCDNLLAKQAVTDQQTKDVAKLADVLDSEVIRLRWLTDHGRELATALTS